MSPAAGAPRVRFAPSPTGDLHVGNARTALFNWLYARRHGGVFVLRIEDTDAARSTGAHEAAILADLRWLGLSWDEGIGEGGAHGPYRQSERLSAYRDEAERLVGAGLAYPCFCPLTLLDEERRAQRALGRASIYPGRCRALPRDRAAARRAAGEAHALRFDVAAAAEGDESVRFDDRVYGEVRVPMAQIGDFVLLRQDGMPAYNFAVVVDDRAMRITHVIRGEDHLSNTSRQLLLYRALKAEPPLFAHLPLLTAPGGQPLSKRDGAAALGWFRERGYPPEALLNHLALLGWSPPGGVELLTVEELVAAFDLERVSRAPAVFDRMKLDALSMRHIARMPKDRLAPMALEHLGRAGLVPEPVPGEVAAWVGRLAEIYAERLACFADLPREAALVFGFDAERSLDDPDVRATLVDPAARRVIGSALAHAGSAPVTAQRLSLITAEVRRETGAKGKDLFHPIRVGFTGRGSGPELVRLLPIVDEGASLPLPHPIVACAARARALLDAAADAA